MDSRKQAVSIRMSAADVRNIKKLAKRLGVRDSDIIRFAVKTTLAKLVPLYDHTVTGRNLVPVFVESGNDLFRHFDLDAMRLESILNDGVEEETRVDIDDIQLIAMNGIQQSYAKLRMTSIGAGRLHAANGGARESADTDGTAQALKKYLYDKYVYSKRGAAVTDPE